MITKLLIYKILQLFAIMIIGFIITKLKIIDGKNSVILSKLSLFLFLPSAIINAFDFQLTKKISTGLLYAFLSALVIHIILIILDKLYDKFICKNPVEKASVMYSNSGNLIIPIVSFVLGGEWVVYSTAFLAVQLFFIWSHGLRLFAPNEKFNIKKVLLNVNIIAIFIGMALMISGLKLPSFVKDITSTFGSFVGPLGMLIAGILAANIDFKKIFCDKKIYRVIAFRLVIYPIITLVALWLLSFIPVIDKDKILLISFLASITPAAATVMQFAQIYDKDSDYATAISIFSTFCCILTMPIFVALFDFII